MNAAWRIIDANLNRAREALRVLEEYARFVLNDALLVRDVKAARHRLAELVEKVARSQDNGDVLYRARDIVGDPGRDVKTTDELERVDAHAVARAAGKRLSEALRAVEEYGKTIDPVFARNVERLRYHGYELERRLALTDGAQRRFRRVRLYVIVTDGLCAGDWFDVSEAVLRGGADCLQLREKDLPDRELLDRAKRLVGLCRRHEALAIVNDRPDIAEAAGADGVHVGQDDVSVRDVRRLLPPSMIVGVSTHTPGQVEAAAAAVPDYITVGPMFDTATKPQDRVAGPETLAAARLLTSLPLVAIGGIDADNVERVLRAAPCAVCVCRAAIAADDVATATRRLRSRVDELTEEAAGVS